MLYTSFRILSNDKLILNYLKNAKEYLETYVVLSKDIYGKEFEVLNVHSLLHLCDDVEYFKCDITKYSAFQFESKLGKIKADVF